MTLKSDTDIQPISQDENTASKTGHLSLVELTKSFGEGAGKVTAVDHINLDIKPGEFITLLGPSGCGKTTTLRMIAGFEDATSGQVMLDGENMAVVPPNRRPMSMVFQSYALFPHMSIADNVGYGLKMLNVGKDERKRRIEEALALVDLAGFGERYVDQISGGQQQRVALARALVLKPKVLLFDEPLSNLDAKLRNQMRAEIIKLRQRIDTTFIYVTHDQTEAMTLGDRIVIMKDGVVQQVGTPQEVFDHPANLFVSGFIGVPQMNYFDAELVRTGDTYEVQVGGIIVVPGAEKQARLLAHDVQSQPIVLGIRPEHVSLLGEGGQTLHGTVEVSEMMGSSVHLHLISLGQDVIVIVQTTDIMGSRKEGFSIGQDVSFTFGGDLIHMFSKADERNLEF